MKTFIFPGQGSQSKGMGESLFDHFQNLTDEAGEILGYSIRELCLEDPRNELNQTEFTQPALYVVNALSYLKAMEDGASKPNFMAGHSLGEYNALFACGCFDFGTGLKLVKKRGELMSQAPSGAMAAVLKITQRQIAELLQDNGATDIDLANFNTPYQTVISGPAGSLDKLSSAIQRAGGVFFPLKTSGPFHSRYMEPAREQFADFLEGFSFSSLEIPVISNVSARPYTDEAVKENLSSQIVTGVHWYESVQYLLDYAETSADDMTFEEIGHGDVLTKMVATIRSEIFDPRWQKEQTDGSESTRRAAAGTTANKVDKAVAASEVEPKKSDKQATSAVQSAESKVDAWNKKYGIGTKVRSTVLDYGELETRTEAMVLFGHRAAIYMKGYNGYFDLDEISPT